MIQRKLLKRMGCLRSHFAITLVSLCSLILTTATEAQFREEFNTLSKWSELRFPRVKKRSVYRIGTEADGRSVLVAESAAAASALLHTQVFNPRVYPILQWRWKNSGVIPSACVDRKRCDDYPIRLYVLFPYQPEQADFWERRKYAAAKLLYGQYPPAATLNYVWANSSAVPTTFYKSPYTAAARLLAVERGAERLGVWQTYERNIAADYRAAFDEEVPEGAQIAVMADTDDTGTRAKAYLDFIEVSELEEKPGAGH